MNPALPHRPANRLSILLNRLVLLLATALLVMIGLKFILDPASSAAESGIMLTSPVAYTNERASFGAFPLAGGLVAFVCLLSDRRHLIGLAVTAVTIGTALTVRIFGVVADGTLKESSTVLAAEAVLLALCSTAMIVRRAAGRSLAPAGPQTRTTP